MDNYLVCIEFRVLLAFSMTVVFCCFSHHVIHFVILLSIIVTLLQYQI